MSHAPPTSRLSRADSRFFAGIDAIDQLLAETGLADDVALARDVRAAGDDADVDAADAEDGQGAAAAVERLPHRRAEQAEAAVVRAAGLQGPFSRHSGSHGPRP